MKKGANHQPQPFFEITLNVATTSRADQLILSALRQDSPQLSRATLKRWFEEDRITPAGAEQPRLRASTLISAGTHTFRIEGVPPAESLTRLAQPSPRGCFLDVILETEQLLVLNKSSGIASIPHSSTETDTAVSAALAHAPGLASIGKKGLEPGILHRLDTGTSGLLVFAKTESEFQRLRQLWSTGQVRKTYRALVMPSRPDSCLPSIPIELRPLLAHHADSNKRMIALDPTKPHYKYRGKPLPTLTRLISAKSGTNEILDLELEIETGVMHQIRCTLASLGFPILGDPIYRGQTSSRLWLHAWKLGLCDEQGNSLTIEAPLPCGWNDPAC